LKSGVFKALIIAMKRFTVLIVLLACFLNGSSQDSGVHFVQNMSWGEVKVKAKKENKFIFMDCFTTWCGPCRHMAREVFTQEQVGSLLNKNFISIGVQLDTTTHDPQTIKAWYSDAHMIADQFKVNSYPTFLFFNPDGQLVYRTIGSVEADQFISYANDAMNPLKQYSALVKKYQEGDKDSVFLEALGQLATTNGNTQLADSLWRDWIHVIKNPFTKERLVLIARNTKKTTDTGFKLFYNNTVKIDQIVNKGFAEAVISGLILQNSVYVMDLFDNPSSVPDWNLLYKEISNIYGTEYGHRLVTWIKVPYYKSKKQYDEYRVSLIDYLKKYSDNLQSGQLNNFAWDVFMYCNNPEDLAIGVSCSERSLKNEQRSNPEFLDTYANLLYKSGRTKDAIEQETRASELADPTQKSVYLETLAKMKSGQKTWK
jgi:thioredoxin-related protein